MLRRAPALDAFREKPVGHYLAGATWVHAALRDDLFAVLLWGRPNEDDARALVRSLAIELEPGVAPHRSLVDAERIEGADLGAFAVLNTYVREHHRPLSERVTRLALVRPNGLEGAVVAGFYQVLDAPYPVQVFEDARAGLRWLGEPEPIAAALDAIALEEAGTSPVASAVRAYVAAHLASAHVDGASKSLGLSSRTLQRRLELAGTSFQQELMAVRLAEAERRMLDSDAPLTVVALDSGFGTLQHFSAAFRRARGVSPSQWRAKHKG
jgi:AraC-like DNA-binding protein